MSKGKAPKRNPSDPLELSPMKTFAGGQLNSRNARRPPIVTVASSEPIVFWESLEITYQTTAATIPWQVAIPSMPSMKLKIFRQPTSQMVKIAKVSIARTLDCSGRAVHATLAPQVRWADKRKVEGRFFISSTNPMRATAENAIKREGSSSCISNTCNPMNKEAMRPIGMNIPPPLGVGMECELLWLGVSSIFLARAMRIYRGMPKVPKTRLAIANRRSVVEVIR
ncbi:hypothetical protein [Pelagicoccus sp. SDUM812003]|uniref:hypothetical protein n=1 Tax=Pelagicoccus sp. SDUM812003 TaxID=3041267 RepID=UPI00280E33AF|nr:hypothetical protein [Pelagicoccus sp. SDUM812003]MDQ8205634.1 hypothetical protein [Pelagicoccus sp. SDUM812003]